MNDGPLRWAMLGMVDGNGHPYSWSAIVNGYDRDAMARCPFPAIPAYLAPQPTSAFGFPGVRVTHVWTDDPADAERVAAAARIPNVVRRPEDVLGQVDAVLIATDRGDEHVARCRPFVDANVPIFVDKPLVDNAADLATFRRWVDGGARILSSSALRYTKEFLPWRLSSANLGTLRYAHVTTSKSWERYGIHALEAAYPIFGPGFVSAQHAGGGSGRTVVRFSHARGADLIVAALGDALGGFGQFTLCGTQGSAHAAFTDTFFAFRAQLAAFVDFLRTGERPFPFAETTELMQMLIAGIRSREGGGREVALAEIEA